MTALFFTTSLSANTLVNEIGKSVKGVKSTFKITVQKTPKSTLIKIDFQKIIVAPKKEMTFPRNTENPLDKLTPKVVIDDVVVFSDNNNSLEGMMVYSGVTTMNQSPNCLLTSSPG